MTTNNYCYRCRHSNNIVVTCVISLHCVFNKEDEILTIIVLSCNKLVWCSHFSMKQKIPCINYCMVST